MRASLLYLQLCLLGQSEGASFLYTLLKAVPETRGRDQHVIGLGDDKSPQGHPHLPFFITVLRPD